MLGSQNKYPSYFYALLLLFWKNMSFPIILQVSGLKMGICQDLLKGKQDQMHFPPAPFKIVFISVILSRNLSQQLG